MPKLSDIEKIIVSTIKSRRVLDAAGKAGTRAIKRRTRVGKGVQAPLAQATPLPKLEDSTVKERRRLKRKGELTGPGATPKKSGLNRTGTMLDSIKHGVGKGKLEIKLGNKEQERKAAEVININKAYTFMNLSKAEFKRVLTAMNKQIEQILRRIKFDDL